ncbi:hypothetical protein DYB31_006732, partial [Aphanomyces astaci]
DIPAFERNITQLKVYYNSFGYSYLHALAISMLMLPISSDQLPKSPLHYPLLGTRLLHLLVENRMAEFHGEVHTCPYTRLLQPTPHPLHDDSRICKVLEARTNEPNPYFKWFMSQLLQTVREAIADCAEVAYPSLAVADAAKMLIFASLPEFQAYVVANKPEWTVTGDVVWFQAPTKHLGYIPSISIV